MPPEDFDIVSDLNDGAADVISSNLGNVAVEGEGAVHVNAAVRGEVAQPKQVDDTPDASKPRSLRDTISDAIKADVTAATPENAQQGDNRPRDPVTGQFLEKTDAEKLADAAAAAQQQVVDPNAPKPVAAPQGIDPQVFSSLPAETQVQLARTMEDVQRQQQRFAVLAPVEQLIAPRIDAWALNGMSPQTALHQLLALSDFAGRDLPGFIKYMAQTGNLSLEELVLGMDADEPVDPQLAAFDKRLAQIEQQRTQEQQQQLQIAHNRTVDEVIAFADEKDQSGNALRPYLSELGDAWLPYIGVVKAQNPNWSHQQVLQQAYENACWANAGVRGKMQEATVKAAEADRLRNETARAEAARTASATVRSGAPTSAPVAPNDPNRSLRDTIRASMAQHS